MSGPIKNSLARSTEPPKSPSKIFASANIAGGIGAILAEGSIAPTLDYAKRTMLLSCLPKALIGGVMRQSGLTSLFESWVEVIEIFLVGALPALSTLGFGWLMGRHALKLPDWRLLGRPTHELIEACQKGASVLVGKKNPVSVALSQALLGKVALGKSLVFACAALMSLMGDIITPAIRALTFPKLTEILTKKKVDNFYAISGLKVDDKDLAGNDESKAAQGRAKRNLKWTIGGVLGLLSGLSLLSIPAGRLLTNNPNHQLAKVLAKFSKHFDLTANFGLSKSSLIFGFLAGGWAYFSTAFNKAQRFEDLTRVYGWNVPSLLGLSELLQNGRIALLAKSLAVKEVLLPWKDWRAEVSAGKRSFLDINLVSKARLEALKTSAKAKESLLRASKNTLPIDVLSLLMSGLAMYFGYLNTLRLYRKSHPESKAESPL